MQSKSLKSQLQHVFVIRAEQGVVTVLHPVTIECFKQKTDTKEKGYNIHNAASKWNLWLECWDKNKQHLFWYIWDTYEWYYRCNETLSRLKSIPHSFTCRAKLQCDGFLTMSVVQKLSTLCDRCSTKGIKHYASLNMFYTMLWKLFAFFMICFFSFLFFCIFVKQWQ